MVRVSARFYTAIISTFSRSPLSRTIRSHTTFQIFIDRSALVFRSFFLFSVLLPYSDISSGLSDIYIDTFEPKLFIEQRRSLSIRFCTVLPLACCIVVCRMSKCRLDSIAAFHFEVM